jgi:hypothetical protein
MVESWYLSPQWTQSSKVSRGLLRRGPGIGLPQPSDIDPVTRCSAESGGIVRPGGTIPGAWVRGGTNMLPCAQSQSRSLHHVGVAVLTLREVSWVLSLRCVWCHGHCCCAVWCCGHGGCHHATAAVIVIFTSLLPCRRHTSSQSCHCHRGRWSVVAPW